MPEAESPFHEPLEAPPGFGVRQSSGALAMQASQPKAPEDWRSPRRCRAIRRFMVPMHGIEVVRALHEASADQPTPDPSQERNWPTDAAPLLGGAGGTAVELRSA